MIKKKNIFRRIIREALLKWRQRCRYDLERKMFPKIKGKKVLFIGVADYIADYPKKIGEEINELWTIDINPDVANFGAKRHIIGNVEDIDKYFGENFFDYIFLCGVLGFGINTTEKAEQILGKIYQRLKKGGILVLGWDAYYSQIHPDKLENFKIFKQVSHFGFPVRYKPKKKLFSFDKRNQYSHIYNFLMKE